MDQTLAEEAVDNGSDETVQWTLTDHLNTVRDIAKYDPVMDSTSIVNHLLYDAFGQVTSQSNPAVDSLFLFTARPFDSDTQLQYNLNRWYDPAVGRWLSEDPIGYNRDGLNPYEYVGNSPIYYVDPTGLDRHHWFMQLGDKGQSEVDKICPGAYLKVDIHRYTTEYMQPEHDFIHQWNRGEVRYAIYEQMYRGLLANSMNCCQLLVGAKALMVAWDRAIRVAQLNGTLSGHAAPFDLIGYRDKGSPPASNRAEYDAMIKRACGSSDELVEQTYNKFLDKFEQFQHDIRNELATPPPVFPPVFLPAPAPVPRPAAIPIPIAR